VRLYLLESQQANFGSVTAGGLSQLLLAALYGRARADWCRANGESLARPDVSAQFDLFYFLYVLVRGERAEEMTKPRSDEALWDGCGEASIQTMPLGGCGS
jgi:hypothetical protein